MRVELESSLFEDVTAFRGLDRLFGFFEDERHQWDGSPDDSVFESSWLTEQSRATVAIKEWLQKLVMHDAWADPHHLKLTVAPGAGQLDRVQKTVGLSQAHPVLECPAYIMVENEISDGRFLTAILRAYGAWDKLEQQFARGWIDWKHAGGTGQMSELVERILQDAAVLPQRILVVRDGDRTPTGIERSQETEIQRLNEACTRTGVRLHVLHKRDAENYLPARLLPPRKVTQCMEDGLSYKLLPQDARDVFDMKKVFGKQIGGRFSEPIEREELDTLCQTCPTELPKLVQTVLDLR